MLGTGGKFLHILVILFVIGVIIVGAFNIYFFSRLGNSNYVMSNNARITMLVFNALIVLLAVVLALFTLWQAFKHWGRHTDDMMGMVMGDNCAPKCPKPCAPACPPKKCADPCAPKCPPVPRSKCDPCAPAAFNSGLFQKATMELQCYLESLKQEKAAHAAQAAKIDAQLQATNAEFRNVCNMMSGAVNTVGGATSVRSPSRRSAVAAAEGMSSEF